MPDVVSPAVGSVTPEMIAEEHGLKLPKDYKRHR
jgi:hypothetical protein